MKRLLFSFTLLCVTSCSFCQTGGTNIKTKEYYYTKSRHQKTTAWILLGSGAVLSAVGLGMATVDAANHALGHPDPDNKGGGTVGTIGLLSVLGSIPLFVSAAHNRHIALNMSVDMQKMPASLGGYRLGTITQPALSLTLSLGR